MLPPATAATAGLELRSLITPTYSRANRNSYCGSLNRLGLAGRNNTAPCISGAATVPALNRGSNCGYTCTRADLHLRTRIIVPPVTECFLFLQSENGNGLQHQHYKARAHSQAAERRHYCQRAWVLNYRDPTSGKRVQQFFERHKDALERRNEIIAQVDQRTFVAPRD